MVGEYSMLKPFRRNKPLTITGSRALNNGRFNGRKKSGTAEEKRKANKERALRRYNNNSYKFIF